MFDDPDEDEDEEDEKEEDEDKAQMLTQFGKPASEGLVPFNPEIHNITGFEKADIL